MSSIAFISTRAPYRPAFALPLNVRGRVGGCACASTVALLASLGMPTAASMHDPANRGKPWTPADTLAHISEEEKVWIPILRFIAKTQYVGSISSSLNNQLDRILADHARWRPGLLAGVMPSQRELDEHAALEDLLTDRYKLRIIAVAGSKEMRVRAGIGGRPVRVRAGVGDGPVLDSKIFIPASVYMTDADRMRSIMSSADSYYNASPAKGDPSKLDKLSTDYPEKAKAAEGEADRKFAEAWVGTKDGAQRVAIEIGGAAALLVIAYPLAIMAVAGFASWEAAKKLWSWVGGGGHGFDQEWTDRAKARITEMLTYGVIPKAFYEAGDVSPMGYAKDLAMNLNVIKNLDAYAGPGALDEFQNVTASVWRHAATDPVIRDDIGKITKSVNGWPLAWAEKTTSTYDSASTSRNMAEMIGLSAAHDESAPVYLWQTAISAAADGWNQGMDIAKTKSLPRKIIDDGADFEDGTGDSPGVVGGGGLAAIYAYRAAKKAIKDAMGATASSGNGPPDRSSMTAPTIDNPTPGSGGGSWTPWVLGAGATVTLGGLGLVSWPIAAGVGAVAWVVTKIVGV